jgi:diacylglycerol kinase family enzyme/membrane-associated phospholipid phosphatase
VRSDVFVVLNPAAPRFPPETTRQAIDAACKKRGFDAEILELPGDGSSTDEVTQAVRHALRRGVRRIVAAGGDGTVGLVANGFVGDGVVPEDAGLAIIPAGTANVLARELGLPLDLEDAIAVALDSEATLPLDGILVEERLVLTQVGVGPDAKMIRDRSRAQEARWGRLAYVKSFLKRAVRHPSHRFHLTIDGSEIRALAWQLIVANAGSMGSPPFTWGPRIDPTDGMLDLCLFEVRELKDALTLAWRLITGQHRRRSPTRFFRIREELTIDCAKPLLVQGDGELIARTPVRIRTRHPAIRVFITHPIHVLEMPAPDTASAPARPSSIANEAAATQAVAAEPAPIAEEVRTMVAGHSRTWVLQGLWRHPIAALEAIDAALYLRANRLNLGRVADAVLSWMSRIMHYGEGWAVVALALILSDFASGVRIVAEALPVLWMTMLTVNYPLKRLFRRRRPFLAFVKARVLGARPADFSLPSGHSAAAFAGAYLFGSHVPGWSALFYSLAAVVGFSRVYFGVHYPSDVVLGGIVGILLTIFYRALVHAVVPGWF